jgi:hypothetical protein
MRGKESTSRRRGPGSNSLRPLQQRQRAGNETVGASDPAWPVAARAYFFLRFGSRWDRSLAATRLTALLDFGFLRSLAAVDAAFLPVAFLGIVPLPWVIEESLPTMAFSFLLSEYSDEQDGNTTMNYVLRFSRQYFTTRRAKGTTSIHSPYSTFALSSSATARASCPPQ